MASIPIYQYINDLEWPWNCSDPISPAIWHMLTKACLHINHRAYVAHSCNCCFETEDQGHRQSYTLKVVLSPKWCKTETLLLEATNRKWYITYQITLFSMTLRDLQGHSPIASLFICSFYSARILRAHCKRCISYGNSVCPSVRHTPVLCQNDGT